MKIVSFKGPSKGDIPGIDDNLDRVLKIINEPLEQYNQALSGRLNVDNLNEEIREIEVFHNRETRLTLQKINGKCIGVLALWNSAFDYVQVVFDQISETQIKIKCFFTSTPADKVKIRLLIRGE